MNVEIQEPLVTTSGDPEAIGHMRVAIAEGKHWFVAVLEAIAIWRLAEEDWNGRHYCYLIGGEAFDWLLLAERLCDELKEIVPAEEKEQLLFYGVFPTEMGPWEFQQLIGRTKYRAHLNYWYGVLVEEALLLSAEERISKSRHALGYTPSGVAAESGYQWVYGAALPDLLTEFQNERKLAVTEQISFTESREFLYWCFKYRLEHQDPAKVASDTRLGLERLGRMRSLRGQRPAMLSELSPY